MTNVGKELRARLAAAYTLARPQVVSEQVSKDGTRKWLIRMASTGPLDKGAEIECVYIPGSRPRHALRVEPGRLHAHLLLLPHGHPAPRAQPDLGRDRGAAHRRPRFASATGPMRRRRTPRGRLLPSDGSRFVSNIVFMGMGEPLYNTDNVIAAIDVMSDGEGLTLSRRRITVSTSGVVPQMERFGSEANTMLAISLHAVRDELRDELVPINRKYDIGQLLDACRAYPGLSNARRITFEYVMLKGVNDSDADARELVRLLKGIPAKINLIPFNPWPGSKYECSDWERIERFSEIVYRAGYASPVRTPRGRDILAACGQLKSETEKLRARARMMAEQGIGAEGVYAVGNGE